MADKTVSLELKINATGAAQSVGDLKKSIKDLQSAALTAGEQGNKSLADQYIKAAGEAKDKINDLNQAIKNAGSDTRKLDGLVQVGSGIASGFAAAQGAAALFGVANKDLEKTLLKVQAASAIAAGAQQIANLVQKESAASMLVLSTATKVTAAAQSLYATATGVLSGEIKIATVVQKAWNAAMAVNPIGLVVAAAVLLVGVLAQLFTAESDEEKAIREVNIQRQIQNNLINENIEYINEEVEIKKKKDANELARMKLNGATEEQLTKQKAQNVLDEIGLNEDLINQKNDLIDIDAENLAAMKKAGIKTNEQAEAYKNLQEKIGKNQHEVELLKLANDDLNLTWQTLFNSIGENTEATKKQKKADEEHEAVLKRLSDSGSPGSIGYYNFLLGESNTRLNKLVPGSAAYNAELKNNIKLQKDLAATQQAAKQAAKSPEELQKAADAAAKKAEELKIKQAADFAALTEKEYADSIKSTSEYYDHLIAVAKLNNKDTTALENKKAEELIGIGDEYGQKTLAQQDALLLAKKKQKEDAAKKEVDDAVKLAQENLASGVGGSELENQIALENALYEQAKVANTNLEELEKTHLAKIAALKKAAAVSEVLKALKIAQDSLSAIQNLSDVVYSSKLARVKKGSKEEEAILRKQFETNKKMQIASAIINGALAVTNIIATVPKGDFGVSTAIMLVSAASATAASIAKIASTKFDSGGGGVLAPSLDAGAVGAGGGAVPNAPGLNQPTTNIPQGQGTTIPETKVYVTETDIKRVGNRVNVIESRATFR